MEQVTIGIDRDSLPAHTDAQFEEWVGFCVGHGCSIDNDNPLSDMDMSAIVIKIG
ncbi:TPA: hypothetical protein ACNUVO_003359 [Aeromonas salmonicida subsp. pectinolytica]